MLRSPCTCVSHSFSLIYLLLPVCFVFFPRFARWVVSEVHASTDSLNAGLVRDLVSGAEAIRYDCISHHDQSFDCSQSHVQPHIIRTNNDVISVAYNDTVISIAQIVSIGKNWKVQPDTLLLANFLSQLQVEQEGEQFAFWRLRHNSHCPLVRCSCCNC